MASRTKSLILVVASALTLLAFGPASEASPDVPARITVVQAVPGTSVDVAIDDTVVAQGAEAGALLGPFDLPEGEHTVSFEGDSVDVVATLEVSADQSADVVLHLPAERGGDPVVHSYLAPMEPLGSSKARVMVAHTATVAPADVRVDGQVVFSNIANGEFAEAELPAGSHRVSLLPTGVEGDPILGPLEVDLAPQTVSMVYAFGLPSDGSMDVIMHTSSVAADGTVRPDRIETGSVGLVAEVPVEPFAALGAWGG